MQKFIILLFIGLMVSTAVQAKKQSKGGDPIVVSPESLDRSVMSYVEANVLATMYHELAHALIDGLSLPIFSREEDAADTFVVVITDHFFDAEPAEQLTWASADQYARDAEEAEKKGRELAVWDTHSLDLQRYYNLICLYYGGDVDARDDEHALLVFGAILGITLALEGPAAPQYMMKRVGTEEGWSLPPDIPVYEVN